MATEILVHVRVSNPRSPRQSFDLDAFVDNGSTDSAMPARLLRKIGVRPVGTEVYESWGRRTLRKLWGEARFQIGDRPARTCLVTFEPEYETPTLGAQTLETLGYNIDMMRGALTPAPRRFKPGKRRVPRALRVVHAIPS